MIRNRIALCALSLVLLALPAAAPVAAQDAAEPGIGDTIKSVGSQLTWQVIFDQGGVPLKVIVVLSVFVVALIVYLLVILRPGQVVPGGVLQELVTRIQEGELNTNDTFQWGESNDNATYQQGLDNANRTRQRGMVNWNETGQFGQVNFNQTDQRESFKRKKRQRRQRTE